MKSLAPYSDAILDSVPIARSCWGRIAACSSEWTPDQGRIFEGFFAIDAETTKIDDENPHIIPSMVARHGLR